MNNVIDVTGSNGALELFGIRLVGVDAENGKKLLLTLVFIALALVLAFVARLMIRTVSGANRAPRFEFWSRQAVKLLTSIIIVIGIASVWFDDPVRLTSALGLITAGLAFALQKVVSGFRRLLYHLTWKDV